MRKITLYLLLFFITGVTMVAQPQTTTPAAQPTLQTSLYRAVVSSVQRKANNFTVTVVFENLTDKLVNLRWGNSYNLETSGPYLVDEKSAKYTLQDVDTAKVVNCSGCAYAELLPKTKLKTDFIFFGEGNGKLFTFMATEFVPSSRMPIAIKGLTVTSTTELSATEALPTFITESYRAVVTDVQKDSNNVVVTLVLENLLDKPYTVEWGEGRSGDNDVWEGKEPYLIDENADRYYLRERDSGKIVFCSYCEGAEILPGTKLKTRFVFKISGTGNTFTLATKERSPKSERPVVITGLKPTAK